MMSFFLLYLINHAIKIWSYFYFYILIIIHFKFLLLYFNNYSLEKKNDLTVLKMIPSLLLHSNNQLKKMILFIFLRINNHIVLMKCSHFNFTEDICFDCRKDSFWLWSFDGWLVGWFYIMSNLVGLFYAEVSLTIMISSYIQYRKSIFRILLNE